MRCVLQVVSKLEALRLVVDVSADLRMSRRVVLSRSGEKSRQDVVGIVVVVVGPRHVVRVQHIGALLLKFLNVRKKVKKKGFCFST